MVRRCRGDLLVCPASYVQGDFFDMSEDVLLRAFSISTKASGYYRDRFDGDREPQRLVMGDYNYGRPTKAEDADVVVLRGQDHRELHLAFARGA